MEIKTLILGPFATNTYLLKEDDEFIIIDPAGRLEKILPLINGKLIAILLTHGHFDHIKTVDSLYKELGANIYLMSEDLELTSPDKSNINNKLMGYSASISSPIISLEEKVYRLGKFEFNVIKTPGHTNGSCIFVFEDKIFTGDTLFKESIGRSDLHGGNESKLKQSLKIFKNFKDDYLIYPGHGESTTLNYEKINNYYLR